MASIIKAVSPSDGDVSCWHLDFNGAFLVALSNTGGELRVKHYDRDGVLRRNLFLASLVVLSYRCICNDNNHYLVLSGGGDGVLSTYDMSGNLLDLQTGYPARALGIAADGKYYYLANNDPGAGGQIKVIDKLTHTVVRSEDVGLRHSLQGLTLDGAHIVVMYKNLDSPFNVRLDTYQKSDLSLVGSSAINNQNWKDLCFDGRFFWAMNNSTGKFTQLIK